LPVIAGLAVVQLTPPEVHPNVTIRDELVVAAREIRADIESRYSPGDTDRIEKLVALIDAACVDAFALAKTCVVAFTRSARERSQYRISSVIRPEIRPFVTFCSTTMDGVGARFAMCHSPGP